MRHIPVLQPLWRAVLERLDHRYAPRDQANDTGRAVAAVLESMNAQEKQLRFALETLQQMGEQMTTVSSRLGTPGQAVAWEGLLSAIKSARADLQSRIDRRERDLYQQIEGLVSLYRLLDPKLPLPALGGWSLAADVGAYLVGHVLAKQPRHIIELGSGSSTVLLALAVQKVGTGRIISLEHDSRYLQITKQHLEDRGLTDLVDLVLAPLIQWELDGRSFAWYDIYRASIPTEGADLIVVDGPPSTQEANRFPALPLLDEHLARNGALVLDDARRPDEQSVITRWQQLYPAYVLQRLDHVKGTAVFLKPSD